MKLIVCESCEAEFRIKHSLDENYYKERYCPFCGEEQEVVDEILKYKESFGVDNLLVRVQWPGLGQGEVLKTLDHLGKIIATVS